MYLIYECDRHTDPLLEVLADLKTSSPEQLESLRMFNIWVCVYQSQQATDKCDHFNLILPIYFRRHKDAIFSPPHQTVTAILRRPLVIKLLALTVHLVPGIVDITNGDRSKL